MKPSNLLMIIFITLLFGLGVIILLTENRVEKLPTPTHYDQLVLKVDSLEYVIDSLNTELKFQEDGFDSRERRYEDVISEYEMGLSYLKDYHPVAYRDFHRIIGMKERYSHELVRENTKRLKTNKF
jgi:hypothetical protein